MIIGREKEQRELLSLLEKEESQFCAVYGRRRVGKTYLIRETFNYQFCFQHTGVAKGTLRQQLTAFRNSLMAAGLKCAIPKNWIGNGWCRGDNSGDKDNYFFTNLTVKPLTLMV